MAAWSVISVTRSGTSSSSSWSLTSATSSRKRARPSGARDLVELGRVVAQLEEVRPALLAVIGPVLDRLAEARALEGGVEDRRRRLGRDHRHQPLHELAEDAELRARAGRQVRVLAGGQHRLPQRGAARLGPGGELLDGLRADPPRRHVDDPQQRDPVRRIAGQADVAEGVLDLAPLVEADAAHELVRDAEAHERLFEHAATGR